MIRKTFDAKDYSNRVMTKAYDGQSSTAADGGETIPTPLADYYMDLLRDSTFVRQLGGTIGMTAKTLEIPKQLTGNTLYVVGEGKNLRSESGADGSSTAYSKSTMGSITLTNYKLGVLAGYTTELAEDSLIDIARFVITNGALAMAEGEEMAFIWGSSDTATGQLGDNLTAGQPSVLYDGLIDQIPHSGDSPVGVLWTPEHTDNGDHIIDAEQSLLAQSHLNKAKAIVENEKGNGSITDFLVPPNIVARMRDPVEWENFQSLDKIGGQAALLTGGVGNFYNSNIISSGHLPTGDKTAVGGYPQDASGIYVSGATDGCVIGLDRRSYVLGQRRGIEVRTQHNFDLDVEEIRFLERLAFKVRRPEWLVYIGDVKNSA